MKLEVVILAAGQGTRMRSDLPKVLHPLANKPLLAHVLASARMLMPVRIHVVIGHGSELVREALDAEDLVWVMQEEQLGTAHAVLQAMPGIDGDSTVLILYGDVPLLRASTLEGLIDNAPALLTAVLDDPEGYGRVLRDSGDQLEGVVEHKDATEEQRRISEINTGVLAYPASLLADYLPRVGNANAQGEFYLPDVLSMAVKDGHCVAALRADEASEVMGINDRIQLAEAETVHRERAAVALMTAGVSLADPARIDVRGSLHCGRDVFIDVNCVFEGEVTIGEGVHIGPNCVLKNCTVGVDTQIHAMSHIDDSQVGGSCSVGPYARLRPGTVLADGARIGNFVETKKATIGPGSKVNHLSYVGDAELGGGVNIGAGTITCNYDGVNKHKTSLGDDVFIGSNSTLVAPLDVGEGGFVAAGSTVTRDVPESSLGVSRAKQRNIAEWQTPKQRAENDETQSGD
ncbi:bifunctional UDP-N-acetylglucosamine diphosphorylase/glucosamine-1-phosphate N-acetyltransferase GlmU [Congregibacter litoralis]|uniref:Bifunctional protein GlmU n=1 Tax=Congregibacter litoralis KT71 TaxID=314285 RepID=A4A976_9GAMM|nr:bifunctional UDP-N-acetylglucosamine diphosphorylase/glucosamine-1-phosphate N-acetyltransferase GlmU [Congregibacter litoralis]EAQ97618.1 UDP-N-acetylglucosamine pyrophosphorylase/glucosamine-1-phosphate N-acetyltransferase [Congregibacter litoralis KT71]